MVDVGREGWRRMGAMATASTPGPKRENEEAETDDLQRTHPLCPESCGRQPPIHAVGRSVKDGDRQLRSLGTYGEKVLLVVLHT